MAGQTLSRQHGDESACLSAAAQQDHQCVRNSSAGCSLTLTPLKEVVVSTQQFGHADALGVRKGAAMDESAFSDYVMARRPQLFRTACLLCGDPHRAEDVVQDALARLYSAWDRVGRMDNIDGYVRRIIVNAHYSDRRRPWRRERPRSPARSRSNRDIPWKTPTRSGPRLGRFHPVNVA
jgi:hypothetical protein